ncbi:UDP-N-acetylglucosamine 2-epimerase, partial [Candidatus Poribacteria bacterium]|nr:UDP-N-acetylglucosamine 2-epimerase [Candidatus Poribacteria bacterium]
QVTRWHLAPTAGAAENLRREGLPPAGMSGGRVVVTGNTGIDALGIAAERVRADPPDTPETRAVKAWKAEGGGRKLVLVTGHRRENFGGPLAEVCAGLREVAEAHPEALILYAVHLNPNVSGPVHELLGGVRNVRLAPALEYPAFVALMTMARLIITDSGGVQEEAPTLGVPVLVTRKTTERPEALAAGSVKLVGPSREALVREATRLLREDGAWRSMAVARSPYGDGRAAARCIGAILGEEVAEFVWGGA